MERRFELRKTELLADCQVHPAVFTGGVHWYDGAAGPIRRAVRGAVAAARATNTRPNVLAGVVV
jgi:hypothetical protein